MTRHTKPPKFTGRVIDVLVEFHLDLLDVVAEVKSQAERLMDLDSSDVDDEEPAEEEGSTDNDDESPFCVS
jgi:hypothetical protein